MKVVHVYPDGTICDASTYQEFYVDEDISASSTEELVEAEQDKRAYCTMKVIDGTVVWLRGDTQWKGGDGG